MERKTKERGITLITLIVTVIVLLILAGISVSMIIGENGIITKTKIAQAKAREAQVKEEVEMALMAITADKLSEDEEIMLKDLSDENSKYSLDKKIKVEWIDKNSNPLVIKKDGLYCYIYEDLTFELSEKDETYAINTNLQNCRLSSRKTRLPKESFYQTQIILDEFYEISSISILLGDLDVTNQVYDDTTKTITVEKLSNNLTIDVSANKTKAQIEAEIRAAIMAIIAEKTSEEEEITLNNLADENSKYSLDKKIEIEWIDKNSNPLLIKKDGLYCYIYEDLTFVLSETNETYTINTNLQSCRLSNTKTRLPKESSYASQIILEEFYKINTISILLGGLDITDQVYDDAAKTITIEKLTNNLTINISSNMELNNVTILARMIDKNCNYTKIEEIVANTDMLNKIVSTDKTIDYMLSSTEVILPKVTSNTTFFSAIANSEKAFSKFCENADARLNIYNNYTITESILASSETAKSVMMKSSRYQVVSGSTPKNRVFGAIYADKAFVLGVSQAETNVTFTKSQTKASNCLHVGNLLSGPAIANMDIHFSNCYGSTGLVYRINKFASNVGGCRYNHYGGNGDAIGSVYFAIFKI